MKIETKFNVNEIVWVIVRGRLVECEIGHIYVKQFGLRYNKNLDGKTEVIYTLYEKDGNGTHSKNAQHIFTTKQEAGEAWMEEQGLEVGLKDK